MPAGPGTLRRKSRSGWAGRRGGRVGWSRAWRFRRRSGRCTRRWPSSWDPPRRSAASRYPRRHRREAAVASRRRPEAGCSRSPCPRRRSRRRSSGHPCRCSRGTARRDRRRRPRSPASRAPGRRSGPAPATTRRAARATRRPCARPAGGETRLGVVLARDAGRRLLGLPRSVGTQVAGADRQRAGGVGDEPAGEAAAACSPVPSSRIA